MLNGVLSNQHYPEPTRLNPDRPPAVIAPYPKSLYYYLERELHDKEYRGGVAISISARRRRPFRLMVAASERGRDDASADAFLRRYRGALTAREAFLYAKSKHQQHLARCGQVDADKAEEELHAARADLKKLTMKHARREREVHAFREKLADQRAELDVYRKTLAAARAEAAERRLVAATKGGGSAGALAPQ